MELRDLEYFAVVAEQGSVRKAADMLNLSQPAVSKSLRRLEAATGTALVTRTVKGVQLTAVGARLLGYGQRLRWAKDEIAREIADLRHGHTGLLHIGAASSAIDQILPAACATLFVQAPQSTVKIAVGANAVLMPALRNGEFELAVSGIPVSPPEDLVQQALYDDRFVVVAAADHPLAGQKTVSLARLANERWVLSRGQVLSEQALRSAFAERGLPAPRVAAEAGVTSLRLPLVSSSGFLGFTSRRTLDLERKRYRLVEIPVRDLSWHRRVGVSYRKGAYLSPLALRFIDILKGNSGGNGG